VRSQSDTIVGWMEDRRWKMEDGEKGVRGYEFVI
jgi:hypothetical protein